MRRLSEYTMNTISEYTILVSVDDMEELIVGYVRGSLDEHVILHRILGALNHRAAIEVLPSLSRVTGDTASAEHKKAAGKMWQGLYGSTSFEDTVRGPIEMLPES